MPFYNETHQFKHLHVCCCVFLVLNVPLYVSDDDKHTINSCLLLKTTLFNNITHPFFMRFFGTIRTN